MIDNKNHLPNHLAIIMDGNGRWAEQKGKKRIFGHKNGIKAVQKVVEEAVELKNKIPYSLCFFNRKLESSKRRNRGLNEIISE